MNARDAQLHPAIVAGILINTLLLMIGWVALRAGPDTFFALAREDRFLEWLQFVSFTALALMLTFIAHERLARDRHVSIPSIAIGGLALLVALAALEEVSWFQRVLGIETPEFFQRHNRQIETNLHNLFIGEINLHKAVVVRIIFITGITHNLILPLLALKYASVREKVEALGLYLPPLSAAFAYLFLLAVSQLALDHPRRGEVSETLGAIHYLTTVFAAYVVGVGYAQPIFTARTDARRVSVMFLYFLLFIVFLSWLIATINAQIPV